MRYWVFFTHTECRTHNQKSPSLILNALSINVIKFIPKSDLVRFLGAGWPSLVIAARSANLSPHFEVGGLPQENLEFPMAKGLYSAPVG